MDISREARQTGADDIGSAPQPKDPSDMQFMSGNPDGSIRVCLSFSPLTATRPHSYLFLTLIHILHFRHTATRAPIGAATTTPSGDLAQLVRAYA